MKRAHRAAALLAFACVGALSACSVGPRYSRPDIPLPSQWHGSGDGGTAGEAAPNVWPAADWWRGFGSQTLNSLIAEAQAHNDDLAGAMARVQEADAQARVAGAALLPSADLGADASREHAKVSGLGARTFNVFTPQVTASYELDFWGKIRATHAAARAAAAASRFDQRTIALTVISSVATTYFQALELRGRMQVAQDNLANGEKILQGIKAQAAAGIATGLDSAQQETTVALLNAAIPPLRQQFRQTVNALAVLVGVTPESLEVDVGTLKDLASPAVIAGMPSQLLARRPDIAQAEQQLIAANADITVARAALFPSIQLTASGGYTSSQLASLISPANRAYAVSAGLTQPIFHNGALRGQLAFSQARYRELLTTYHKTVILAFSNVENALVAAQQTDEQRKRQQRAVTIAQRAYRFAQTQMTAGTVNILTVLNTENALFSAQDELVQVEYFRLQALVDLFTALGGGWQQG